MATSVPKRVAQEVATESDFQDVIFRVLQQADQPTQSSSVKKSPVKKAPGLIARTIGAIRWGLHPQRLLIAGLSCLVLMLAKNENQTASDQKLTEKGEVSALEPVPRTLNQKYEPFAKGVQHADYDQLQQEQRALLPYDGATPGSGSVVTASGQAISKEEGAWLTGTIEIDD